VDSVKYEENPFEKLKHKVDAEIWPDGDLYVECGNEDR